MVQGGFYGGFKGSFYGNGNKTEDRFGPGFNHGGNRAGVKEGVFLPIVGDDPRSKNHGSVVTTNVGVAAVEEHPQRHKRTKYYHMGSPVTGTALSQGLSLHPLEEPSPLGLTLKKTPSFIELIQMNLSQGDSAVPLVNNPSLKVGRKKDSKCTARPAIADKHKASNFPASVLRIGSWECISRYEGDLVAKCYFAKHKLVWEVLEGGLKSKIEIQWSDITSLKASFPDNKPSTLEIEVSRPPLFFKETDPQPRKHTVWQATSDFTAGQASIYRRHFLQFAEGILERHYEKLLQCDDRLNLLSKEGITGGVSLYFDSRGALFQNQNEQSHYGAAHRHKSPLFPQFDPSKDRYLPPFSSLTVAGTPRVSSLVEQIEHLELDGRVLDATPQDTPSPCSVMDSWTTEESGISDADDMHVNVTAKCDQMIFAAHYGGLGNQDSDLLSPKSMDTLVNRTVSCLSEKKFSHTSVPTGAQSWQGNKKILDDIGQHLLSDLLLSDAFDEQKVTPRVNSMYSLIEKDVSAAHASNGNTKSLENAGAGYGLGRLEKGEDDGQVCERNNDMTEAVLSRNDSINSQVNGMEDGHIHCKQSTGILREDSFAENVGAGYGLGRLEKGEDDGQVRERNDDMTEAVLNRNDRINSQVNGMEDGYRHCKQSTGIPREDSFADLLLNIPRIASFPQLFVDSSDEFFTSVGDCLGRLEKGEDDGQVCERNDDMTEAVLSRNDRINSQVNGMEDGYIHCKQSTDILREDSFAENAGAGYDLGRLEKGVDDGQVCERNEDMTEAVLSRNDRINSQVNGMEDGYRHCKQSTGIPREDSFADLLLNIPRIASVPQLFVDSSDEFFTSARDGLGRLEKGEDDGQVCERNNDTTEAVLSRNDRINSQVNGMEDGYIHCKQSTGIPREDSFADLLVNIPRIASFPQLFVDSSDEFFTSAEQPETA